MKSKKKKSNFVKKFLGIFFNRWVIVSIILLVCLPSYYLSSKVKKKIKISENQIEQQLPLFIEDLKILSKAQIFKPVTYNKNAKQLIEKHIKNIKVSQSKDLEDSPSKKLFKKHCDFFKTEKGYEALIQDPEFKKMDVEWIRGIKEFDHIDISLDQISDSQLEILKQKNEIEKIGILADLLIFNSLEFVNQAVVFALKNVDLNNVESKKESLSFVHHAAQLLISIPEISSQMYALILIRHEFYLSQKWGISLNDKLNLEMIERFKRVGFSWLDVLILNEIDSNFVEVLPFIKSEFLVCGTSGEVYIPLLLRDFLEPRWPLEPNFNKIIDNSRYLFDKMSKICAVKRYSFFLTPTEKNIFPSKFQISSVPFLRRSIGSILLYIGIPNQRMKLYNYYDKKRLPSNVFDQLNEVSNK